MSHGDNWTSYKRPRFFVKFQFNEEVEFKLKKMSNSDGSEEMLDNTELSDDNYVTYIIGEGTEIVIHRFKIELEDGQDIEAVIKQLDDEMEAMHGQIRFRMDWNYTVEFIPWCNESLPMRKNNDFVSGRTIHTIKI